MEFFSDTGYWLHGSFLDQNEVRQLEGPALGEMVI